MREVPARPPRRTSSDRLALSGCGSVIWGFRPVEEDELVVVAGCGARCSTRCLLRALTSVPALSDVGMRVEVVVGFLAEPQVTGLVRGNQGIAVNTLALSGLSLM